MQDTQEMQIRSLGGKIPWSSKWQPTPVLLPGKSCGKKSLVGYSPWGHKESNTTEQLNMHTCSHNSVPRARNFLHTMVIHRLVLSFFLPLVFCNFKRSWFVKKPDYPAKKKKKTLVPKRQTNKNKSEKWSFFFFIRVSLLAKVQQLISILKLEMVQVKLRNFSERFTI